MRIDVRKDRPCAAQHDAVCSRDERSRRNDDFVARSDAERKKRELQRDTAVRERDGAAPAERMCEFVLEGRAFVTGPVVHLAGAEHRPHGVDLVACEMRPGRQRRLAHARASVERQDGRAREDRFYFLYWSGRHGEPPTRAPSGTSLRTVEPAPMTDRAPMRMPGITVVPAPTSVPA